MSLFQKKPYKRDYILQKRPQIIVSLLIVATPYVYCMRINGCTHVQPIAFEASYNRILQSQSSWSLFNGTWQKRRRELDH